MIYGEPNSYCSAARACEALIERHMPKSLADRKGLPSADEVRRLTANVPRIPAISGNLDTVRGRVKQLKTAKAPRPTTLEARRAAAKEAVRLAKDGLGLCKSLNAVGLHAVYAKGLRECLAGGGPITDAVRSGDLSGINEHHRKDAVFIRWFFDIGNIRDGEEEQAETAKLREAFNASGLTLVQMEKRSGISRETLFNLRHGRSKAMRVYHRRKVWAVLNSQN